MLGVMALALAAGTTTCEGLVGRQGKVEVIAATTIRPMPDWRPDDAGQRSYRARPVTVTFCRVEGRIERNIGFELWLPQDWNGRLLGAGVGGDAGIYNYVDMSLRIAEGFATVTTDSGHKASQTRWMADAKARVDYEHRAVHLTALAAKALSARFYGRQVDRAYFSGCSGGGRQALKEMQSYPADYDGVVAGAPGPYMPLQSVRMMWFALQQKWHPGGALTDADWSLYEQRATQACDRLDGVADGIVANPVACTFRPARLTCEAGQARDCLSAAKIGMLDAIVSPLRDERGAAMDTGLFPGVRTRPGAPSPLLRAMWADAVYDDPNWDEDRFSRSGDLAAIDRVMPELRADHTAIAPFIARGGKAILYQGWADPSTNAGPTLGYYRRLEAANRDLPDSVRLMMVPGMYHCRGGPGADQFGGSGQENAPGDASHDVLWAVIDWVEKGKAPARLTAAKLVDGRRAFTRALCPFPKVAHYDGKGPTAEAASYSCHTDPVLAGYR